MLHGLIITVIGAIIAFLFVYDFTSFSYFDVTTKSANSNPFDFFSRVAESSPTGNLSKNVAIVDLGDATREEIAEALKIIDSHRPAAIGLDVVFSRHGCQGDTLLAETICSIKNIVHPVILSYDEDAERPEPKSSFFDDPLMPDRIYGVLNLDETSHLDIVRNFKTVFEVDDTTALPSFPMALAELKSPGSFDGVQPPDEEQTIYFNSVEFLRLDIDELEKYGKELRAKCVLVGRTDDYSDLHRTPVGDEVDGIVIHAVILEQLLSGNRMTVLPPWLNYLLAFSLAYLFVLGAMFFKDSPTSGLVVRAGQFILILAIAFCGSLLFIRYHVSVDFVPALSLVAFSLVAFDLYFGAIATASSMGKLKSYYWKICSKPRK